MSTNVESVTTRVPTPSASPLSMAPPALVALLSSKVEPLIVRVPTPLIVVGKFLTPLLMAPASPTLVLPMKLASDTVRVPPWSLLMAPPKEKFVLCPFWIVRPRTFR